MQAASPNWKKPSDVMKKRLVRRRTPSGRTIIKTNQFKHLAVLQDTTEDKITNKKRQNPFACGGPAKKICKENVEEATNENTNIFHVLDHDIEKCDDNIEAYKEQIAELQQSNSQISKLNETKGGQQEDRKKDGSESNLISDELPAAPNNETKGYPFFPTDWSLKSKIRFISATPFSWCSPLKTSEESMGITEFLHQTPRPDLENSTGDNVAAKVEFQKNCMIWMHPHVPWLKLFPRIVNETKIGKPSIIFQSPEVQKSLLNDWTESLSSVFHMLRSEKCAYFYLCSHQFTAIFRANPVPGVSSGMHAILTPTSRGIRQLLQKEGVEFTMPLNTLKAQEIEDDEEVACINPDKQPKSNHDPQHDDLDACKSNSTEDKPLDDQEDVDLEDTHEGASSWLEMLGIDKTKYKSLNPNKIMLQKDVFKIIDNRPESAVLVEGPNTMALMNFLLNSRSCVQNTGELAGVPATIIAPVAFKGATLKSYQVKQSVLRQQLRNGAIQDGYSVELNGPLLPSNILGLTKLFENTQKQFSFSCSVVEPSTPFNLRCSSKANETLNVEEIDQQTVSDNNGLLTIPINDINNGRQALREMTHENGLYTWS